MNKMLLITARQDRGLTLIEVLIATLIVIVFIAVSLQALTVAALFKSRGKLQIDAINWVQQDLEAVRDFSSTLSNPSKCKAAVATNGYAELLKTSLTTAATETKQIAGINYVKQRTTTISGGTATSGTCNLNACYEVLQINYQVKGTGAQSGLVLADVETEVIPDAVFQCPL